MAPAYATHLGGLRLSGVSVLSAKQFHRTEIDEPSAGEIVGSECNTCTIQVPRQDQFLDSIVEVPLL